MKGKLHILFLLLSVVINTATYGQKYSPVMSSQNDLGQPIIQTFPKPATTKIDSFPNIYTTLVPANYNALHVGFFCKEEIKMEQAHIPLKIRLGSLEYCNWLEQKPGYKTLIK